MNPHQLHSTILYIYINYILYKIFGIINRNEPYNKELTSGKGNTCIYINFTL